jgi:hypothetical protein
MSQEPSSDPGTEKSSTPSIEIVAEIVKKLEPFSPDVQRRIIQVVRTWLHPTDILEQPAQSRTSTSGTASASAEQPFSGREEASPKEFMLEKDPKTDAERITCLAYYLTHYRDQPYFKTEDLSRLNTEAAQRKFANAAFTSKNAFRDGFLTAAPKAGFRQLSAFGEQYVQALPDHDAAKNVRKRMKPQRARSKGNGGEKKESTETAN